MIDAKRAREQTHKYRRTEYLDNVDDVYEAIDVFSSYGHGCLIIGVEDALIESMIEELMEDGFIALDWTDDYDNVPDNTAMLYVEWLAEDDDEGEDDDSGPRIYN